MELSKYTKIVCNVNKIHYVNIWSRGLRSGIDLEIKKDKRILPLSIFFGKNVHEVISTRYNISR
jgi:hypothetical protein